MSINYKIEKIIDVKGWDKPVPIKDIKSLRKMDWEEDNNVMVHSIRSMVVKDHGISKLYCDVDLIYRKREFMWCTEIITSEEHNKLYGEQKGLIPVLDKKPKDTTKEDIRDAIMKCAEFIHGRAVTLFTWDYDFYHKYIRPWSYMEVFKGSIIIVRDIQWDIPIKTRDISLRTK
jgi:hypothetical protein